MCVEKGALGRCRSIASIHEGMLSLHASSFTAEEGRSSTRPLDWANGRERKGAKASPLTSPPRRRGLVLTEGASTLFTRITFFNSPPNLECMATNGTAVAQDAAVAAMTKEVEAVIAPFFLLGFGTAIMLSSWAILRVMATIWSHSRSFTNPFVPFSLACDVPRDVACLFPLPPRPEQSQIIRVLFTTILYAILEVFSYETPPGLLYLQAVAFTAFLVLCASSWGPFFSRRLS